MSLDTNWLLSACRAVEPQSEVSSTATDEAGRPVVCVRLSSAATADAVLAGLRARAPYMQCSRMAGALDGAAQVRATLPTRADARRLGKAEAAAQAPSRWLRTVGRALLLSAALLMLRVLASTEHIPQGTDGQ